MAMPANKPNGTVTAYYANIVNGVTKSCVKHLLDKQDYAEALKGGEKALWSTSAQSGTVIDNTTATFQNGCYRGYE